MRKSFKQITKGFSKMITDLDKLVQADDDAIQSLRHEQNILKIREEEARDELNRAAATRNKLKDLVGEVEA